MKDVTVEPIVVRGRVVFAALVYASGRGDYRVYEYRGRRYVVRT
jgi:hypothetical protein